MSVNEFGKVLPLHYGSSMMALSLQMPVFHWLIRATMIGMTKAGRNPTFLWGNPARERMILTTESYQTNAFGTIIKMTTD